LQACRPYLESAACGAYSSLIDDGQVSDNNWRVNMNTTRKLILAAVVLSQALVALPAVAAGKCQVVRLETMTIVGKRPVAAVATVTTVTAVTAPVHTAQPVAQAGAVQLEPMVIVGHRDVTAAAPHLARMNTAQTASRAYPL
jgi:hypothetical protein